MFTTHVHFLDTLPGKPEGVINMSFGEDYFLVMEKQARHL